MDRRHSTPLRITVAVFVGIGIGFGGLYCWDHHQRYSRPEVVGVMNQIDQLNTQRDAIASRVASVSNAEQSSGLGHEDDAVAREAVRSFVAEGAASLPMMRDLAVSAGNPVVRKRANDVIGQITGNWGSQVDLVWKRSLDEAKDQGKPILLLQLFGNLDEEFC